jgi:hypothetical protein
VEKHKGSLTPPPPKKKGEFLNLRRHQLAHRRQLSWAPPFRRRKHTA